MKIKFEPTTWIQQQYVINSTIPKRNPSVSWLAEGSIAFKKDCSIDTVGQFMYRDYINQYTLDQSLMAKY